MLHEITNPEVDVGDLPSHVGLISFDSFKFVQQVSEPVLEFRLGLLERVETVSLIAQVLVLLFQILEHSPDRGDGHYFFVVTPQKVSPVALEANIYLHCVAFSHQLVTVLKVRESNSWVLFDHLWLDLIEPVVPVFTDVSFLLVGHFAVLEKLPTTFRESPHVPIPQQHFPFHKIFMMVNIREYCTLLDCQQLVKPQPAQFIYKSTNEWQIFHVFLLLVQSSYIQGVTICGSIYHGNLVASLAAADAVKHSAPERHLEHVDPLEVLLPVGRTHSRVHQVPVVLPAREVFLQDRTEPLHLEQLLVVVPADVVVGLLGLVLVLLPLGVVQNPPDYRHTVEVAVILELAPDEPQH